MFIRGSVVRYVMLPRSEVDVGLLEDATRRGEFFFFCLLVMSPAGRHMKKDSEMGLGMDGYAICVWKMLTFLQRLPTKLERLASWLDSSYTRSDLMIIPAFE